MAADFGEQILVGSQWRLWCWWYLLTLGLIFCNSEGSAFCCSAERSKPAPPYYPGGPDLHQTQGSGWPVAVVSEAKGEWLVEVEEFGVVEDADGLGVVLVDDDDDDEF